MDKKTFKAPPRYRKRIEVGGVQVSAAQIDYGVGETYEVAWFVPETEGGQGYWYHIWRGDERPTGLLILMRTMLQKGQDLNDYRYHWDGRKFAAVEL